MYHERVNKILDPRLDLEARVIFPDTTDFQSLAPGGVEFSIRESVIITRAKIDEILMQSNPDILNFAIQTFTIQYDNRKLEKRATNTFFVF